MNAIEKVYSKNREFPLIITSVKTNIGHCESAAGISGLIKVILCMIHEHIPAHLHLKNLNPRINLANIPAIIPTTLRRWTNIHKIAGVSAFALNGTNAHVIVQKYIGGNNRTSIHSELPGLVTISARSSTSIQRTRQQYISAFENSSIPIQDIAYTSNICRSHFSHRISVVAGSATELARNLRCIKHQVVEIHSKIVFIFFGEISLSKELTEVLYNSFSQIQTNIDYCENLLQLSKSVIRSNSIDGKPKYKHKGYFEAFCLQYSLYNLWKNFGVKPDCVIGSGIGEFAACACAGLVSIKDAIKLVMSRIQLDTNLQCENKLLVPSSLENVITASQRPSALLYQEYFDCFRKSASCINIGKLNCKYVSCAHAGFRTEQDFTPEYWIINAHNTPKFVESVYFIKQSYRTFIEIGMNETNHNLLVDLIRTTRSPKRSVVLTSSSISLHMDYYTNLIRALGRLYTAGHNINWSKLYEKDRNKISLPMYQFDRKSFWITDGKSIYEQVHLYSTVLHPIIGQQFPSYLSGVVIFCKDIDITHQGLFNSYQICSKTSWPVSLYLECFLAASYYTGKLINSGNCMPHIQDIHIHTTLLDYKKYFLQIVVDIYVSPNKIKIFAKSCQENSYLELHASASIAKKDDTYFNIPSLHISSLTSCAKCLAPDVFLYKKLEKLGVKVKSELKSVIRIWSTNSQTVFEVERPQGFEAYQCHPSILLSMLQIFVFHILDKPTPEIYPISAKDFILLSEDVTRSLFAHFHHDGERVVLYNNNQAPLAMLIGLKCISEKTLFPIKAFLTENTESQYVHETWEVNKKIDTIRVDMCKLRLPTTEFRNSYDKICYNFKTKSYIFEASDVLTLCFLMKSIQECNWLWPVGGYLTKNVWERHLPAHFNKKILHLYFDVLCKSSYMLKDESSSLKYTVLKPLLRVTDCESKIGTIIESTLKDDIGIQFIYNFGINLTGILQGKMSTLSVLFPKDEATVSTWTLYNDFDSIYSTLSKLGLESLCDILIPLRDSNGKFGVLKILEIGAGSGSLASAIMKNLNGLCIEFDYTFTDVSQRFVDLAVKSFGSQLKCKVLNIEVDPLIQGYAPREYDIVIAGNVIHATSNIVNSLINAGKLLRKGGRLVLLELFRPLSTVTFPNAHLDGWWIFEDFRDDSPLVSPVIWRRCLLEAGFSFNYMYDFDNTFGVIVCTVGTYKKNYVSGNEPVWVIVKDNSLLCEKFVVDLQTNMRKTVFARIERDDCIKNSNQAVSLNVSPEFCRLLSDYQSRLEGVLLMFTDTEFAQVDRMRAYAYVCLQMCQGLAAMEGYFQMLPKVIILTKGVYCNIAPYSEGSPSGALLLGMLNTFRNEYPSFDVRCVDIDPAYKLNDTAKLCQILWIQDNEGVVAFRGDSEYVPRLQKYTEEFSSITMPNSDKYRMVTPVSSLRDIHFESYTGDCIRGDQVEITVAAVGLNFRDILLMLKPSGVDLNSDSGLSENSIGIDVSGIVVRVGPSVRKFKPGDEVVCTALSGGFASHITIPENLVFKKPKCQSFAEGASTTTLFQTAIQSLINIAQLSTEDNVLIHAACGGIGLAAIQIAQKIGSVIFATVGSIRKQRYLTRLGVRYVYCSRNTTFGERIMHDTRGVGVSVVLNSLTSKLFKETTLSVCSTGARFVELSKINTWDCDEIKLIRTDVNYTVIDAGAKIFEHFKKIYPNMQSEFIANEYVPVPITTYPIRDIVMAFHFLESSQHIGKVVLHFPDRNRSRLLNRESTYIVTGGTRGIGLKVTRWMLDVGAGTIIVVGRCVLTSITDKYFTGLNREFIIVVVLLNISVLQEVVRLIQLIHIFKLPKLKGIIHAAGVSSEDPIPSQTIQTLDTVLNPKVLASYLGMFGQCSYVAASNFLDALANFRYSIGLPGKSINWGPWAKPEAPSYSVDDRTGLRAFLPDTGLGALYKMFYINLIQIGFCSVPDWNYVRVLSARKNYFNEIETCAPIISHVLCNDYTERIKNAAPGTRMELLIKYVEQLLRRNLKIPSYQKILTNQPAAEFGLDSLLGLEIMNNLESTFEIKFSAVVDFVSSVNIQELAAFVDKALDNKYEA